jgi:hypothetical protein
MFFDRSIAKSRDLQFPYIHRHMANNEAANTRWNATEMDASDWTTPQRRPGDTIRPSDKQPAFDTRGDR